MFDYDLFVIGAGSGGVRAARIASENGAKVAIAEEYVGVASPDALVAVHSSAVVSEQGLGHERCDLAVLCGNIS